MGNRVYQTILECMECSRIPEDGEPMWQMPGGYICESCAEEEEKEND